MPLLIHLLHRQRAKIEVFPSLDFLRKMMRKKTRRFHLKQILLLIARILLLIVIALALARPTITGGRAVKGHLPTTAVIILDDSFSMLRQADGTRLFEIAKAKVLDLLAYFDRSDDVRILAGSSPTRDLAESGSTDPERLRDRVSDLSCTNLTTDIGAPLRQAVAALAESRNPNKEIYIVSDMQNTGWDAVDEPVGEEGSEIKVMIVDLGEEDPNACVRDITFRIPVGTEDLEMEVTLERFNSRDDQGRVAEVFLKGMLLDRAVFSAGEFTRENETFRIPSVEGFLWGEVAMAADRLEMDDRRYFALASRRRTVGMVGETYYVRTALSPKGGGTFEPIEIEEGTLSRETLSRVEVLVAADVARFSALEIEAISDYLAQGGSLLIFLGGQVDIGAYNRNLLPRLGTVSIGEVSRGGDRGFFTIEKIERGHTVFAKFKADESPFSDAKFYHFMKIKPDGGRVIASFSDGSPAMVELSDRVMLFASSADISWNDFALTSQFLPILHETLLWLTSRTRPSESYNLGTEIVLKVKGGEGQAILEGPAGAVRHFPEVAGEISGYRIDSPEQPGVYFLKTERETLSIFAVNVDTSESDLTKVQFDRVKSHLRHFDVTKVSALDDIGESVSLIRKGRDLVRLFLWAALALVIFETLLASNISLTMREDQNADASTHS